MKRLGTLGFAGLIVFFRSCNEEVMFFPEEEFCEIKIRLLMELKFFILLDRKSTVVMQMDNEGRGKGTPVSLLYPQLDGVTDGVTASFSHFQFS